MIEEYGANTQSFSVLLVDSSPTFRSAVIRVLARSQIGAVAAATGQDALNLFKQDRSIDIILCADQLPDMDCGTFMQEIITRRPLTTIVLIASEVDTSTLIRLVNSNRVFRILSRSDEDEDQPEDEDLIATLRRAEAHTQLLRRNSGLLRQLKEANQALEASNRHLFSIAHSRKSQIVNALAEAIKIRSTKLFRSGSIIGLFAKTLGEQINLSTEQIEDICLASRLEGLTLLGAPETYLEQGPSMSLDMTSHRENIEEATYLLEQTDCLQRVAEIISHRRARWDGSGRPAGLAGQSIALGARILSVAETISRICLDPAFNPNLDWALVREDLQRAAGRRLDPKVVQGAINTPDNTWRDALSQTQQHVFEE